MPPAEFTTATDLHTIQNMMDFSRSGQGFNNNFNNFNDLDNNNDVATDQELLRRMAASRAAGLNMSQGGNSFGGTGPGASAAMFGQGVTPNQFSAANSGVGTGSGFPMMHGQAGDREEELLLQLLLARRRRQEIHDFQAPATTESDELIRLRQAGNAAAASSAATAAMFAADQDQQIHHLQQQQQQGGFPSMFNSAGGLSLNAGANFMMQDQMRNSNLNNFNPNSLPNGRRFDDYLLQTQRNQSQESVLGGMNPDQQRIELSPSRFLSLQKQQQGGIGDFGNKRAFGDEMKMGDGLDKIGESVEPPSKKKRLHKKKPSDMPRRPLSAYNLFFSEERERILKEIEGKDKGDETNKDEGSEKKDESKEDDASKPRALLRPLLPSEKKRRPHRKTHGKISFRLLAQMVGQRWKALSDDKRKYYQDLAKEDMVRQKKAMEEYYMKQSEKVKKMDSGSEPNKKEEENEAEATL